jgi:DNA-binding LytR/AlgR family response regulator
MKSMYNTDDLTYILADDNELYNDYTYNQLKSIPGISCLAQCYNALETREKYNQLQPDFLILDIEMPGFTGLQLIKSLKHAPLVIFITSHMNYAYDAFEIDAVDYLVKPVATERLLRAIDKMKVMTSLQQDKADESFQHKNEYFFIKDKNMLSRYAYSDVVYIESLGNFVTFHLGGGSKKIALVSLSQLELQLSSNTFLRISRNNIINMNYITAIDTEATIYLGHIQLPIGKVYADAVTLKITEGHIIKRSTKSTS